MFDRPRPYFYGSTTDHVVKLRPSEAAAVNKILIKQVAPGKFITNLSNREMKTYDRAATILNAYLATATTGVYCSDEDAENGNIVRPVN